MRKPLTVMAWALRRICLLTLTAISLPPAAAEAPLWVERDATGERRVHLYFFWTRSRPHCQAARPFVEAPPARHPWLRHRLMKLRQA